MTMTKNYPFTTPGNYTPSADAEVSGGVGLLTDRRPAGATFYASWPTDEDANWGGGTLTGTLQGTAAVGGGLLQLPGNGDFESFLGGANIGSDADVGCIRMRWTPRYSGTPGGANRAIFHISKGLADSDNNLGVYHAPGGNLLMTHKDSAGAGVNITMGAWSAVQDQEYEFELNWDRSDTGGNKLVFIIDGTVFYNSAVDRTRDNNVQAIMVGGATGGIWDDEDMDVNDFAVFSTWQHKANYTPTDWSEFTTTIYSTGDETIEFNDSISPMETLDSFTETSTKPGADEIKYILQNGATWQYWNGAAWVTSNETYAEANTAAEIETNKAAFSPGGGTVSIRSFLHSVDGTTTPENDLVEVEYSEPMVNGNGPMMGLVD